MILRYWFLELLYPARCVLCDKILEKSETDLCRSCRLHGPECPISQSKRNFLDSWLALWYYEGEVRKSVMRYKFYRRRSKAEIYGRLLAMKIREEHPEGLELLVWVPVSWFRKLRRGYDQVELLACAVGSELDMKPEKIIKKNRNNPPQSKIAGEAQRRANVLGVYRLTDPELVRDKRILLLDDVITTGATASEVARVLKTAGAKEVHFGAVAAAQRGRNK